MTNPSQVFAASLTAHLVSLGVKDFYLAPGARSQALAIALSQLADAGKISLTVRLDERTLGFTALGRALATGAPVAIVTTSGSAVANLHPAILEAHHAGVALLVLSSDRPARLRGKGANQTTYQKDIFGSAAPCIDVPAANSEFQPDAKALALEALDLMLGQTRVSPAQLNLQFEEPLSAGSPNAAEILRELRITPKSYQRSEQSTEIEVGNGSVVIAGAGAGEAAEEFARLARLPLFAEPSSGARFGEQVIVNYPQLLGTELAQKINRVVVFGKPSLSRSTLKLLASTEHYVVRSSYESFNVFDSARLIVDSAIPVGVADQGWLESFREATKPDYRAEFVSAVWDSVTDQALMFGASDLIRVAEGCVAPKKLKVFANRGLAGIDGTISTAIGIAQAGHSVKLLMGDLTLIHELSGLNLTGLTQLELQLIVGNDRGGHIFDRLEMRENLSEKWFETLFTTPQSVELEKVVVGFGWTYVRCENLAELEAAMRLKGFVVIDYQL